MVSGAIVTVKTDDGTLQLTEEPGTGLYSCPLSVREGERISITASHEGFADVSSTIEVPCRPDFEIVSRYSKIVEQEEKFRTVERHFKIKVRDNPDRKEFYQFRISSDNSGQFTYTSDVAFMDTDDIEGII